MTKLYAVHELIDGIRRYGGQQPLLMPHSADRQRSKVKRQRHVGPPIVTVAPQTYDTRFQLAPDEAAAFKGEFSRLGVGRYIAL